jgi:hypothetical protein
METVISTGNTFRLQSTGGWWTWVVTADNTFGVGQLYQVDGIVTPYGRLVDVSVPIPGDVIAAMADTITQMQQLLAPLLAYVAPFTPTFTVTVTEGDPILNVGIIPIQNAGAFGSFMSVVATSDVPWTTASPPSIIGIGKSETAQISVQVSPAALLATSSPYTGHVNLQDNRNPPTNLQVTLNVTVLPRPMIGAAPSPVGLTYSLAAHSSGGPAMLTITNIGPLNSQLTFTAAKLINDSPWLAFTPTGDGPLASGGTSILTLSVVSAGVPFAPGTYVETLRIMSLNASNSPIDVPVQFVVT